MEKEKWNKKKRRKRYIKGKFKMIQMTTPATIREKTQNQSSSLRLERSWDSAVERLGRHLSGGHEVGLRVASGLGGRATSHSGGAREMILVLSLLLERE